MLRRRLVYSGFTASAIYGVFLAVVVVGADNPLKPWVEALPAALAGLAFAFVIGATLFGFIPHYMGIFMSGSSSVLDLINRISLAVALCSVLIGVISGLLLIFGSSDAIKPLLVAITLFLGASATMCSLKFFYINRGAD